MSIFLVIMFLVEITAVISCFVRGVALGRAFLFSMLFQFVLGPVLVFLTFVVWNILSPIPKDIDSFGPRFSHQMDFVASMACCIFVSTIVASCLGALRFFVFTESNKTGNETEA
jgi:hypothetical protein